MSGGLSKLGEVIARIPLHRAGSIIVSRIGSEGMELAKSSGARVSRAEGLLKDPMEKGFAGAVEVDPGSIDPGCPCCSLKHRQGSGSAEVH